jgi:hypothetical protein
MILESILHTAFGTVDFLHGIRKLKYHAIAGVRCDRQLIDGRSIVIYVSAVSKSSRFCLHFGALGLLSSGTPDYLTGDKRTASTPSYLAALLMFLFLLDLERMRPLALSHGDIHQLSRCEI